MPNMENQLVRGFLQNASIGYKNGAYINQEIFPLLDMPSPKAKITQFNVGDAFRNTAKLRARGAAVNVQDFDITEVNQDTKQYDQAGKITKEDLRDAGVEGAPTISMEQEILEQNADKIDLAREIRVAAHIKAATWADTVAGGEDAAGNWAAAAGSSNTFFADIQTAVNALKAKGVPDMANMRLAMDWKTFWELNQVADIRDVIKYTSQDRLSPENLARYLGISKIVVGSAIYNTAQKVKAGTDMTGAYIWDSTGNKGWAFLYYYPARIGLKMMAAGVQPRAKMDTGLFRSSYRWYENKEHSHYYDTQEETGITTIYNGAGYQWTDTHTT